MESLFVATEKKITMDKFFSQIKIVPEGSVKKILNAGAKVVVADAECQNNIVSLSGKVVAEIVYLSAENVVCRAENSLDFIEKQRADFSLSEVFAEDLVSVENVNFLGSDVVCSISHNVKLTGVYSYEIPKIENEEKEYVFNKKQLNLQKFVCACSDDFVVAEDVEKNLTNVEILQTSAKALVTNYAVENGKIVIDGKILSDVLILSNNEITSFAEEFDFKQEIAAEKALTDMSVNANVVLKNIMVTPEIKDEKTTFIFAVDLYAKAYVYETTSYELVSDMFSLKNEIEPTYDYIEANSALNSKNLTETVVIQSDVSQIEGFDDVFGVSLAQVKVLDVASEEGKVFVSAEVSATAFYKTLSDIGSFAVSKPVVIEIEKETTQEFESVSFAISVASFKVKAGKDLEVALNVRHTSKFVSKTSEQFIKSFETKQEKESSNFGIKVYVSKQGQTVFNVAKILNVTPDTILSQNQVDDVFESGQKIYVYSPVNLA